MLFGLLFINSIKAFVDSSIRSSFFHFPFEVLLSLEVVVALEDRREEVVRELSHDEGHKQAEAQRHGLPRLAPEEEAGRRCRVVVITGKVA